MITALSLGAQDRKTVWNGVYSDAQAARGEAAYAGECSGCHKDDLSGFGNALRGDRFMDHWREDKLSNLFTRVKAMPPNAPGSLDVGEYIDILAYILRVNGFPTGKEELARETLARIVVEGQGGPAPVPEFSLVQVVGCLVEDSSGEWVVSRASEPVRTRNPDRSTGAELKAAEVEPLGRRRFRVLDASNFQPDRYRARKVEAKGFLIRKPGDDRLNLTSLGTAGSSCSQ